MQKSCIFLVAYCLGIFTLAQASPIGKGERKNLNKAIKAIKDLPDDADKLTALQKNGVKASNYLLKFFNKSITEVEKTMMVADKAMLQFRGQTDSLDLTKFKYTKQFIANHTRAKSYLLAARRDLVSLSTKQVHLCNNIEISINSWEDQHASFLIKNQFKQLKRLIQETKTKFESIHKNIDQIYTAFIKNTDEFEGQLKNAQENGTAEYNLWTNLIENSYNDNDDNSTVTIGEVIAALSKCSGCDGVSTVTTWINAELTPQDAIIEYKKEIKEFTAKLNSAWVTNNKLQASVIQVIWQMMKEKGEKEKFVTSLDEVLESIDNTMKKGFTKAQIDKISALQSTYKKAVLELKKEAQELYTESITHHQ